MRLRRGLHWNTLRGRWEFWIVKPILNIISKIITFSAFYIADDLVILSPSVKGLQKLLNICSEYGEEHDIMFNHKKTECMYFPVKGRALINIPKVFLNAHLLRWVTKYKYLGIILTDDLSDDCNMLRQRGICYARSNSLIRNFSLCSLNVKVKLF